MDGPRIMHLILPAIAYAIGMATGWAISVPNKPHCPTEESCWAVYEDGEWEIVEVTP